VDLVTTVTAVGVAEVLEIEACRQVDYCTTISSVIGPVACADGGLSMGYNHANTTKWQFIRCER
jgi:hypothetical protein